MISPIAIMAGNGVLPLEIAKRLTAQGREVFICAIEGEAADDVQCFPHAYFRFGQIGKLFKTLSEKNVSQVIMAGGVIGRPDINFRNVDFGGLLTLPRILSAMLGGDNEILESVVRIFQRKGFQVVAVPDLLPELVAIKGENATAKTKTWEQKQIAEGKAVIATLAPHDIGQGCVIIGKRAVAIEGAEGTDAMLQRIIDLRKVGRLPNRQSGVLVKAMKAGQNDKVDLPTIGPTTIDLAIAAQLKGVAIEAGRTIIVERETVLAKANDAKLFIHGFGA